MLEDEDDEDITDETQDDSEVIGTGVASVATTAIAGDVATIPLINGGEFAVGRDS